MTASFDPRWEMIHSGRAWGKIPSEHVARFVRQRYSDGGEGRALLDIGCGVGAQSFFLASSGFAVTGIDGSESAIERAKERWQSTDTEGPLHFEQADVAKLPFSDGSFETAVDVCCLQHVIDPYHITAMDELRRVLRPGALFFSITAKWDHTQSIADTPLRTMRRDDVGKLYNAASGFALVSVDSASYSINNGGAWVSHWLITARREQDDKK